MPRGAAIENYARTNVLSRVEEAEMRVTSLTERETQLAHRVAARYCRSFFA
jgi:hypothetical protein